MVYQKTSLALLVIVSASVGVLTIDEQNFEALVKRVESVESENAKLRSQVNQLTNGLVHSIQRRQERPLAVGFTATISQHLSSLGHQHTLVFDKVTSNFGNSYNNVTGYFEAPEDGVYVFYSNIMSETSSGLSFIETEIVKNGDQLVEMYSGAQHGYDSTSNMVVTPLRKGNLVWVRVHNSQSNSFKVHCCFSTFSGFLIGEIDEFQNIVG